MRKLLGSRGLSALEAYYKAMWKSGWPARRIWKRASICKDRKLRFTAAFLRTQSASIDNYIELHARPISVFLVFTLVMYPNIFDNQSDIAEYLQILCFYGGIEDERIFTEGEALVQMPVAAAGLFMRVSISSYSHILPLYREADTAIRETWIFGFYFMLTELQDFRVVESG